MMRRAIDLAIAAVIAALVSIPVRANDSMASARALYAAAEYEDALAALDRLQQTADRSQDERKTIAQYRAYCLLALGRAADAEEAIAVVITATPLYVPPESEVSPRVRNAFRDVRRRILPVIIQERYRGAKEAFDEKRFMEAARGFDDVIEAIGDPDAAQFFKEPPLSDLRGLAEGFRDLSQISAAPPPVVAAPAVAEARPASPPPPPAAPPPVIAAPRIYSAGDLRVVPPVVIHQNTPPLTTQVVIAKRGVLELTIDESGRVEQALLRESTGTPYDAVLLDAARKWTYKPARLQGVPVKYRKLMQVSLR
jgi:TonB family protein